MHIIAGKAICLKKALEPSFKVYQKQVVDNAKVLSEVLTSYDYDLVSKGTDNHLVLVKLINKGITGKEAEVMLDDANITTNKNAVPNDPQSPFVTIGIRLGSAAVTKRGFKEDDMTEVAKIIAEAIKHSDDESILKNLKERSLKLCQKHPLYK